MNLETRFDLLSHPLRRHTIAILNDAESLTRQQLTARLASVTAETDTEQKQRRRRIRIALHHNHLPKLADAGVITYDDETVTATDALEAVTGSVTLSDSDLSTVSV